MSKECSKSFLRDVIGKYMVELGEKDSHVVVVNADLAGTCRNRSFFEKYPERTFNVGIAEQNLVSFSAGLAHEGFLPYAFSMAPFLSMRACEQCRTDVAYAKLPVRLIGAYAGVSGGISGATHWSLEDCGIMTSIPGIIVLEPSDANQARKMLDESLQIQGPMYIRNSVEAVRDFYGEDFGFSIGGSFETVQGEDATILCSGVILQYAVEASEKLKKEYGISVRVVDMYSIKPIDCNAIESAAKTGTVLVAQDHNIYGGLGSLVAMEIAKRGFSVNFEIAGIDDTFVAMAHAGYLYHYFELDCEGLKNRMLRLLGIKE